MDTKREESYGKTWWTRGHVTKRGVLWEDMVKERSPMGRHGGHVTKRGVLCGGHVTKRGVLWEDMVDTLSRNKERSPMGRHGGHVVT